MSNPSEDKPLKGKQKKIAASKKSKAEAEPTEGPRQKTTLSGLKNIGKCVTCVNFPHKVSGCVQPCPILKAYVARKAEHPECYKCKFA